MLCSSVVDVCFGSDLLSAIFLFSFFFGLFVRLARYYCTHVAACDMDASYFPVFPPFIHYQTDTAEKCTVAHTNKRHIDSKMLHRYA